MATQLTDEELFLALDAEQHHQTLTEAAQSLGLSRKGYSYRLEVARDRLGDLPDYGEPIEGFSSPELPTDEMPTDELIEHMKRRYSTRKNAKDARDPIPIKMKSNDPVGLLMFGDIHVDSPQCNWPELDRCVAICESTEGMRGVSLGDHTDNWIGRL